MKLVVAVVDDRDVDKVMKALTRQHIGVTCISSSGDLLSPGNSTLLIGVGEENLPQVQAIIAERATTRQEYVPYATGVVDISLGIFVEVLLGGYMMFVLDIKEFEQV